MNASMAYKVCIRYPLVSMDTGSSTSRNLLITMTPLGYTIITYSLTLYTTPYII